MLIFIMVLEFICIKKNIEKVCKMSLLILSRLPAFAFKFDLNTINSNVFIFTEEKFVQKYKELGVEKVIGFENYLDNDEVIFSAIQIVNSNSISQIIPAEESDVLRAALIRELTGLNGQSYTSALLYRDKYLMSRKASEKVSVPHTDLLLNRNALIDFYNKHGSLVVKPRDSWSSSYVHKITSHEQIHNFEINNNLIMQKWVHNSKLCTVDGLQKNGEIIWFCVHEYSNNLLDVIEQNINGFAMMTSPIMHNFNLKNKIKKFTEQVLSALNNSSSFVAPFHLEFFLDERDNITLCEIASRFGGGRTIDLIRNTYNFDITSVYLKLLINPTFEVPLLNELPFKYTVCYKNFFPNGYQINSNNEVEIIENSFSSPKDNNRRILNVNDFEQMLVFSSESSEICYEIVNNFLNEA
jgi:hypothetical protein